MATKTRKRRGRGEGSICQRANGTWQASVSAGYDGNGKRIRRTVYGKTKREVQEKIRKLSADVAMGRPIEINKLTVAEHLNRWVDTVKKREVAASSHERYRREIDNQLIPRLGSLRLDKLAMVHVDQMYAGMGEDGVATSTQRLVGSILGSAMNYAVRVKMVPFNPCRDATKPRLTKTEMQVWSEDQSKAFMAATEIDRLHALFVLALTSGMRQMELLALYWSDIDFQAAAVVVQRTLSLVKKKITVKEPKSGRGRRIELPQVAMDALSEHRKRMLAEGHIDSPVFCGAHGGWLHRTILIERTFWPAIKRAEVPKIRFHDLRHTHATLLLLKDENIKVVSERLGHADIKTTLDTYSHVLPSMQKGAARKLDRMFA